MSRSSSSESLNRYPAWSPRFWHGMRAADWWRLVASGQGQIHPSRWPMAAILTALTPVNDLLCWSQGALYGRRLRSAELAGPPTFILGHWRSGTTLLHELMVLDARFAYPTTYQCFAPHHFLLTEAAITRLGGWLLPRKRPMDNMDAGWRRPQEDEFALMNLGLPSPYRRIAFPNRQAPDLEYLDWSAVSADEEQRWLAGLRQFLQAISFKSGKPLVLKSPTHTGRIALLARAFPDARFIHITRDPRSLLPSTMRLWRSLDDVQGLQRPSEKELESYVLECGRRMYEAFHAGRQQVPANRLVDVRYEALVADPMAEMRRIYCELELGDFEPMRAPLAAWVEQHHRSYQPNRHRLAPDQEQRLRECWSEYFTRYGYV